MSEQSEEVLAIVEQIRPLLAGHGPETQGAVVGNLVAIWIAGFPDAELRKDATHILMDLINELIPVHAKWMHNTTEMMQ